jgi:hypothetical protein
LFFPRLAFDDDASIFIGKLQGIGEQVKDNLLNPVAIREHQLILLNSFHNDLN